MNEPYRKNPGERSPLRGNQRTQTGNPPGPGIAAPLSASDHFPRMLAQVVRIGEETGTLDEHLLTLAAFYEEEVDRSLENLTSLLEPGMVVFVGVIVAFVAISVILPMYSLLGEIR
ncbi:MAG: type II secretion system F family protein [Anaerolineales bacterium]|nr:type II secretion system F family protein [Anaerolineales bacterium]